MSYCSICLNIATESAHIGVGGSPRAASLSPREGIGTDVAREREANGGHLAQTRPPSWPLRATLTSCFQQPPPRSGWGTLREEFTRAIARNSANAGLEASDRVQGERARKRAPRRRRKSFLERRLFSKRANAPAQLIASSPATARIITSSRPR